MNAMVQADLCGYCQTREHDENPPEPMKAGPKAAPAGKSKKRRR